MADPYIRDVGIVEDIDGIPLDIGVDYDTVTIGSYRFTQGQAEEFSQIFVSACWEAAQQKARMDEETGCACGRTTAACAEAGREAGRG